jgi:3-hydroxy-9,10-secoandrosta-1,3,5(10)-triene-9,17-dione monooxygenase reductase component
MTVDLQPRAETMQVTPDLFRRVFGSLPTGVTLVTSVAGGQPVGMVANSVTSVSLSPPLAAVCVAATSTTWPKIRQTGRLCINVLSEEQVEVCRRFVARHPGRFDALAPECEWGLGPTLPDAVAWIDCEIRSETSAGDHVVVIADVVGMRANDEGGGGPLLFFRGRYGSFSDCSPQSRL